MHTRELVRLAVYLKVSTHAHVWHVWSHRSTRLLEKITGILCQAGSTIFKEQALALNDYSRRNIRSIIGAGILRSTEAKKVSDVLKDKVQGRD